jgi:hypothetical protein
MQLAMLTDNVNKGGLTNVQTFVFRFFQIGESSTAHELDLAKEAYEKEDKMDVNCQHWYSNQTK